MELSDDLSLVLFLEAGSQSAHPLTQGGGGGRMELIAGLNQLGFMAVGIDNPGPGSSKGHSRCRQLGLDCHCHCHWLH